MTFYDFLHTVNVNQYSIFFLNLYSSNLLFFNDVLDKLKLCYYYYPKLITF